MSKMMESNRTMTMVGPKGNRHYEYTYRMIMEKHLGRKLKRGEQIHHKDGNSMNNAISNLEIVSMAEHNREDPKHHLGGRYKGDAAGDK